jgi:hypothetical protein
MTENYFAAPATGVKGGARPSHIPAKFWDDTTGSPRIEALARAYSDLERRAGSMVRVPGSNSHPDEIRNFYRAVGVPETSDDYIIDAAHEMVESDPEVNKRLHAAGFSQKQAQLVYDLAAERLLPMLHGLAEDYEARRNLEKIHSHFGGEDRWREVSRQLIAWGSKKLPQEVLRALGASFEGVLALHRMMVSEEPALGRGAGMGGENLDQEALTKLMEDPRYWRDHDPAIFNRVSEGFRRLYPDKRG